MKLDEAEEVVLRDFERAAMDVASDLDADPTSAVKAMQMLIPQLLNLDFGSDTASQVLTTMTSILINAATDCNDEAGLNIAAEVLRERISLPGPSAPWRMQASYNLANAIEAVLQTRGRDVWNAASKETRSRVWSAFRVEVRDDLREVRVSLERSSKSPSADQRTRSFTNLGNALDSSGRWLEAYEAYTAALTEDPTNGNAAGNAAYALHRAIALSLGPAGHIAAVYETLRATAQRNRARTVELAGVATADRWDRLPAVNSRGHIAHQAGDDPYIRWVAQHRLALTPVVEGLGSDDPQFDDVTVAAVRTSVTHQSVPEIFAVANVLKGDFLVARRAVFTGLTMLSDLAPGRALHRLDTGSYTDTQDSAVYGEPAATVIMGARSALDLLDKIAVALNEYLAIGLRPKDVFFRTFWFEKVTKTNPHPALREAFRLTGGDGFRLLALAELSTDFSDEGLYAEAQRLRHLGTHRLVRASTEDGVVPTDSALSTVSISDLRTGSLQTLQVVRAAILYFHALVADHEKSAAGLRDDRTATQMLRSLR